MPSTWILGVTFAVAALLGGQGKGVWTDAADPTIPVDFKLQGEFSGEKLGAQVIALGGGTFQAVLYPGGLPGDGWDGKSRIIMDGRLDGEQIAFKPGEGASPRAMPRGVAALSAEPLPLTPLAGWSGPPIGARLPIDLDGGSWSNGSARMPKPDETVTASRGKRIEGAVAASPFASQKRSAPPGARKRWMATGPLALVKTSSHRTRPTPIGAPPAVKACS